MKQLMRRGVRAAMPILRRSLLPMLPFPYRQPRAFRENLSTLEDSLSWSPDRFSEYKLRRVRAVLEHANAYVPYYRDLFARIQFSPDDLTCLDDLALIPPITKEEVKAAGTSLLSERMRPQLVDQQFTGGSTGEPMGFYLDRSRSRIETSFFYWVWRHYGHVLGRDRVAYFKADRAPDPERKIFFHHDRYYNYLRCDSNYLNVAENFEAYYVALDSFNPSVLFGYPSSIHQLALVWERSGKPRRSFRLVLLASENVFPWQCDLIEKVFSPGAIFYHYGHSEELALAFKCPRDSRMQFVDLYGHVELLNDDGTRVDEAGKVGEVVGTGFSQFMPFIRYRTRDFATLSRDQTGIFPSGTVIDGLEGRLQEFLVTRDERLVSICTLGGYHFPQMRDLMHIQYFQDEPGVVRLRYVEPPGVGLSDEGRRALAGAFEAALRGSVRLVLEQVDEIELSKSNKKSMIVQKLDVARYL